MLNPTIIEYDQELAREFLRQIEASKMRANEKQIAGTHYKTDGEQHWDRIYRLYGRGYFVGCATKDLERYHLKNGKEDLQKSIHFIEKLMELEYSDKIIDDGEDATPAYVNQ